MVSIVALSSLWALGAQAQGAPSGAPPGHGQPPAAGKPGPGHGLGGPGLGHANLGDLKERMGQGLPPGFADRAARLKERAAQLRKEGKTQEADALEKQADRIASSPPPELGAMNPANKAKVRQARKLARVKLLQRRYGDALKKNDVRQEIETHARRSANLSRMKALVGLRPDGDDKQKETKTKLIERINRLMARENARHSRHMAQLTKDQNPSQGDKLAGKTANGGAPGNAPAAKEPEEKEEK
ncbi:MAG TPA: hypothetical protein VHM70_15390 [Polyangiaceae bacterium]|nr:hypothetical protein [Polyangiaceae bacterium]